MCRINLIIWWVKLRICGQYRNKNEYFFFEYFHSALKMVLSLKLEFNANIIRLFIHIYPSVYDVRFHTFLTHSLCHHIRSNTNITFIFTENECLVFLGKRVFNRMSIVRCFFFSIFRNFRFFSFFILFNMYAYKRSLGRTMGLSHFFFLLHFSQYRPKLYRNETNNKHRVNKSLEQHKLKDAFISISIKLKFLSFSFFG